MEKKEGFIRVGTTLYKIVNQPRIGGGYVRFSHRLLGTEKP